MEFYYWAGIVIGLFTAIGTMDSFTPYKSINALETELELRFKDNPKYVEGWNLFKVPLFLLTWFLSTFIWPIIILGFVLLCCGCYLYSIREWYLKYRKPTNHTSWIVKAFKIYNVLTEKENSENPKKSAYQDLTGGKSGV